MGVCGKAPLPRKEQRVKLWFVWGENEEIEIAEMLWNAMTGGYALNGFVEEVLETFEQVQSTGVRPNSTNVASILSINDKMGALQHRTCIH